MNNNLKNTLKKEMNNKERNAVLQFLLQRLKTGKLSHGAIKTAAIKFKVHRRTISRLWKQAKASKINDEKVYNVSSQKSGKCGRKKKDFSQQLSKIKDVPIKRRQSLRSLSFAVSIPKSTLHRILKEGKALKRISSTIKPSLTEKNKIDRLRFCLQHVQTNGCFSEMLDRIHIDEKWFYITKTSNSFYITLDGAEPLRHCKSKRFITKVMFMAAVARPRWDSDRNEMFEGKIGIWSFVYSENAQRNSKNRAKGTSVTKVVGTVNKEEIRKMLIENVLSAIRQKFPSSEKSNPIYIQQDNAKPHLAVDDPNITEECLKDGWNLQLDCQPPNSPDLNVLDLGFFNAIQSLQHQMSTNNIDSLIDAVEVTFKNIEVEKLDSVFLTLQTCMENIMMSGGGNSYKITHLNKEKLRRQNLLPQNLTCNPEAISYARKFLKNN